MEEEGAKIGIGALGFISLILISLGIWIDEYRWKFIFTAIFLLIIAILGAWVTVSEEKDKLNKTKHGKKTKRKI